MHFIGIHTLPLASLEHVHGNFHHFWIVHHLFDRRVIHHFIHVHVRHIWHSCWSSRLLLLFSCSLSWRSLKVTTCSLSYQIGVLFCHLERHPHHFGSHHVQHHIELCVIHLWRSRSLCESLTSHMLVSFELIDVNSQLVISHVRHVAQVVHVRLTTLRSSLWSNLRLCFCFLLSFGLFCSLFGLSFLFLFLGFLLLLFRISHYNFLEPFLLALGRFG